MANTRNYLLATFFLAFLLSGYGCTLIPENDYLVIIVWALIFVLLLPKIYKDFLSFNWKSQVILHRPKKIPIRDTHLEDLKTRIGEGDHVLEEVLEELSILTKGTKYYNEIIMQKSHLRNILVASYSRVMAYEDILREKNRIRKDLLDIIDKVKKELMLH